MGCQRESIYDMLRMVARGGYPQTPPQQTAPVLKDAFPMPEHAPIRLVIVDDHEVVCEGLKTLFNETGIEIVGTAATGDEAEALCRRLQPDALLLDIRLRDGEDGLSLIKPLRKACENVCVIVFTAFDNPTYVARAASAGATDVLMKSVGRQSLIAAIKGAVSGSSPHKQGELRLMTSRLADRTLPAGIDVPLTPRETQVLRVIAMGLSNQEIADALTISVETVKEHVQNLLRKLAVNDRTQAAVWAVRQGIG